MKGRKEEKIKGKKGRKEVKKITAEINFCYILEFPFTITTPQ